MTHLQLHTRIALLATLVMASLCTITISCSMGAKQQHVIAVSIPPQQWLLEQIAGKRYDVVSLLGENSNPEEYESDRNIMGIIERSDAYFTIGNIGFEAAIIDKAHANFPQVRIFNTSAGIVTAKSQEHHSVADLNGDPHVWVSTRNAKLIATNMLNALVELDPKHKNYYTKRYHALADSLDSLDKELKHSLTGKSGQAFAVWHPSLGYFAADYGLRQVPLEPQPQKPASKADMEKTIARQNAKIVLCQDDFDPPHAITTMKQMSVPQAHVNTMAYDWEGQMRHIAATIAQNQ